LGRGLRSLQQLRQRITDPRDHHGPAFHAPHAVDALLQWREFEQVVDVVYLGLRDLALDRNAPGPRAQLVRVFAWIFLARSEFVVVVVGSGVLDRCQLLAGGGQRTVAHAGELRTGAGDARKSDAGDG